MASDCTILYREEVANDLAALSDQVFDECMIMIKKLEKNIHLGQPLQNKNGKNLSGCYKIYFNNAKHRIVYRKISTGYEIIGINKVTLPIAEIIAIGERNLEQVYETAFERLSK